MPGSIGPSPALEHPASTIAEIMIESVLFIISSPLRISCPAPSARGRNGRFRRFPKSALGTTPHDKDMAVRVMGRKRPTMTPQRRRERLPDRTVSQIEIEPNHFGGHDHAFFPERHFERPYPLAQRGIVQTEKIGDLDPRMS